MQLKRRTLFGSPKRDKVLADSREYGIMVSSDPNCIGGLWLLLKGQGTEVNYNYMLRISPEEIEAMWKLYQEKGAGKGRTELKE